MDYTCDMEKIINLLHDIEEQATAVLSEAAEKKSVIYENYQRELRRLDEAAQQATQEKLDQLREEMNEEIKKEHQMLIQTLSGELSQLEGNYRKNHDILAEKMLEKITGV